MRARKSHALSNDPLGASVVVSCRVVWTNNGRGTLLTWQSVRQWQQFFNVLITRGDTRRCTKKRSAGRSCGPAIRAIEARWREERGLRVSESARAREACVCVQDNNDIRGGIIHATRNGSLGRSCGIIYLGHISFARSRQHASIHASPGPPLIIGRHQPEQTTAPTRTSSTLETRPGATRAVPDDRASPRPIIAWRAS